jgi:hypothetical protein
MLLYTPGQRTGPMPDSDDFAEWCRRLRASDRSAYAAVFEALHEPLFRYVRSLANERTAPATSSRMYSYGSGTPDKNWTLASLKGLSVPYGPKPDLQSSSESRDPERQRRRHSTGFERAAHPARSAGSSSRRGTAGDPLAHVDRHLAHPPLGRRGGNRTVRLLNLLGRNNVADWGLRPASGDGMTHQPRFLPGRHPVLSLQIRY